MLGYMTQKEAKSHGVTNHGSYYGIPLWMGDVHTEEPLVFAKWAPLDFVIPLFSMVESLLWPIIHGDTEPMFMFKVGKEI